jgi:NSS family neurotransmitter:Na+ symporter
MYYTVIAGWLLAFLVKMAAGDFIGVTPKGVREQFNALLASPAQNVLFMAVVCVIGFLICLGGVQASVEKITKVMMLALLVIMVALAVRSASLPGASEGLTFYLKPRLEPLLEHWGAFLYTAMSQAFFSLSLGLGMMTVFGSYIKKDRSLFGESVVVTLLDTFVAVTAGLIIFPACFAYGVQPGTGPTLVFITLPNIFAGMPGGRLWGTLFFIFMLFAALSTVVALFENLVSFGIDLGGWSRKKSVAINVIAVPLLAIPCALGFNVWSAFQPLGPGSSIFNLEDFIASQNLMPLGSMVFLFFCTRKAGWGWKNFLAEVNAGKGLKFPAKIAIYYKYVLPAIVFIIFIAGYIQLFGGN